MLSGRFTWPTPERHSTEEEEEEEEARDDKLLQRTGRKNNAKCDATTILRDHPSYRSCLLVLALWDQFGQKTMFTPFLKGTACSQEASSRNQQKKANYCLASGSNSSVSSGIYKLLEERDTPVTLTIRGFVGELNTSPGSDQEHNTPTTCHTWYSPFRWAHHFQLMRLLFEVLGSEAAFTPQALHVFSRE